MAGFIVTSGSHFTPFTYDELVKPIQQFTDAQNTAAQSYSELMADSATLQNYIDSEKDEETSKLYQGYMSKLKDLQDNLWSRGYNAGTVRDLAAARAGYSSDITRIAKAIENRQARSKEYWEMRHKNPDLVAGHDPGLSSLDKYLGNDTYGQDWYSYSGTELAKEVSADIASRANELLRDPQIMRNPQIAGYITRIMQKGFTNSEINRAGNAAKAYLEGDSSALNGLDAPSRIAADVLVSRMQSTGAKLGAEGNLSSDEYNRLFNYAMMGASSGIMAPDIKDFDDKNYNFQQQVNLENLRHRNNMELQGAKQDKSGKKASSDSAGYTFDSVLQTIQSQRIAKTTAEVNKEFDSHFKRNEDGSIEPVMVKLADGRTVPVRSTEELTNYWINTPENAEVKEKFGIDFELPYGSTTDTRQKFTRKINGKNVLFVTGKLSDSQAKELGVTAKNPIAIMVENNGKLTVVPTATKDMNDLLKKHQDRKSKFEEDNKGNVNFRKMTSTPKEMQEMAKDHGLDATGLTPSQVKSAVLAKDAFSTQQSPAVIASSNSDMSKLRDDILSTIVDSFYTGSASSGTDSKDGKGKSKKPFAFYRAHGLDFDERGTTKLDEVFGTLKEGRPKSGSISSVVMYPHDIEKGMVRIVTPHGQFGVKLEMMQSILADTVSNQDFQTVMSAAMFPLQRPDEILRMSEEDNQMLSAKIATMLGQNHAPVYATSNGLQYITLKDVVENPDMRGAYYKSLVGYMNDAFAEARWLKSQYNYQERGNTGGAEYESYL